VPVFIERIAYNRQITDAKPRVTSIGCARFSNSYRHIASRTTLFYVISRVRGTMALQRLQPSLHSPSTMATDYGALPSVPARQYKTGVGLANESIGGGWPG
jgi:hypothetical protein